MKNRIGGFVLILLCPFIFVLNAEGQTTNPDFVHENNVARKYYGHDFQWYQKNIPFFECSDTTIQNVYYYRWRLYKAHLKNLGPLGYIVTEFLNNMSWDLEPYNSLNDATSFHIYEGRWLKNRQYINNYIDFMYKHGGNDRHFSEAIADASYAYYLVNSDKKFIESQLPYMVKIYNEWYDHYDYSKDLYWIEPLLDATEYTISSIDASGGKGGFTGGDAFRPSINSYMYGNALAIKNIAGISDETALADTFKNRAQKIREHVLKSLWNPKLTHFTDRYKVSNQYVTYWHFIRGRELVGYVPWDFDLPTHNEKYYASWKHLMNPKDFFGPYGLRTNEPRYQYYMKQYRFDIATGLRECQWNGPSWPFQTTQVLVGMANLLDNYRQNVITKADYLKVLRQYARQHYDGDFLDIYEDYDPDHGGAIVDLPQRSEHYNHSEFNNLIITGLCGLRPRADNMLEIDPIIPTAGLKNPITYFCLQNVLYHGHNVSIMYDKTGKKYGQGAGLNVWVDGKRVIHTEKLGKKIVQIPSPVVTPVSAYPVDYAVNMNGKGYPEASASYTYPPDKLTMANDGRAWFFKDVTNWWSCYGSGHATDWYSINFGKSQEINEVDLSLFSNGFDYKTPSKYRISYWDDSKNSWLQVRVTGRKPVHPVGNTKNVVRFQPVKTQKVKVTFTNAGHGAYTALSEIEIYEK